MEDAYAGDIDERNAQLRREGKKVSLIFLCGSTLVHVCNEYLRLRT